MTVKEMRDYLRVDHEDDDRLLADLIEQGQQLCMDVARISDEDMTLLKSMKEKLNI